MPDAAPKPDPEQEELKHFLAPPDLLQRILYALLVPLLPYTIYHVYPKHPDDLFLVVGIFWWVVVTFYTLTWIIGAFGRRHEQ